jgi:hypothetical protein
VEVLEVEAKAWTTTSVDDVPFFEASFPTSPPTVLDVVGENLLLTGYLVGAFSVVSSLEALLGFLVPRLLVVV